MSLALQRPKGLAEAVLDPREVRGVQGAEHPLDARFS
jgi:hypothetical protein